MIEKEIKIHFLLGCNTHMAHWIGDGECDNENNNVACDFDGGDCHGSNAHPAGEAKSNELVLPNFKSMKKIFIM